MTLLCLIFVWATSEGQQVRQGVETVKATSPLTGFTGMRGRRVSNDALAGSPAKRAEYNIPSLQLLFPSAIFWVPSPLNGLATLGNMQRRENRGQMIRGFWQQGNAEGGGMSGMWKRFLKLQSPKPRSYNNAGFTGMRG